MQGLQRKLRRKSGITSELLEQTILHLLNHLLFTVRSKPWGCYAQSTYFLFPKAVPKTLQEHTNFNPYLLFKRQVPLDPRT